MVVSTLLLARSANRKRGVGRDVSLKPLRQQPHLELEAAAIGRLVSEDGMLDLGVQPLLELLVEAPASGGGESERPQLLLKVVTLDGACIDEREHNRIGDERAELFHQVKRQRRARVLRGV